MTARVGRRRGDGTEKHSGSRSAVTGVDGRTDGRTNGRTDGVVGMVRMVWSGKSSGGEAGEGGGVRQTGFITPQKEV